MSPRCDRDLEDSKQFLFCVTLWLNLQHHHTKFGNKMFCGSEDITRTTPQWGAADAEIKVPSGENTA